MSLGPLPDVGMFDFRLLCRAYLGSKGLPVPTSRASAVTYGGVERVWRRRGDTKSDTQVAAAVADSYSSIAKVVTDVRRCLEAQAAKALLKKAGLTIHQIADAVTTYENDLVIPHDGDGEAG